MENLTPNREWLISCNEFSNPTMVYLDDDNIQEAIGIGNVLI
jgi:hypothetical protein